MLVYVLSEQMSILKECAIFSLALQRLASLIEVCRETSAMC